MNSNYIGPWYTSSHETLADQPCPIFLLLNDCDAE